MAIQIIVKGADFSANAVDFILPALPAGFPAGLSHANLLNKNNLVSATNLVDPGGAKATIVGTPIYSSAYGSSLDGLNYLDTTANCQTVRTMMHSFAQPAGVSSRLLGASTGLQWGIGHLSPNTLYVVAQRVTGGSPAVSYANLLSDSILGGLNVPLRTGFVSYNTETLALRHRVMGVSPANTTLPGGSTFAFPNSAISIGRFTTNSPATPKRQCGFAAFWNRVLTPAEEEAAYSLVKDWGAEQGLVIS